MNNLSSRQKVERAENIIDQELRDAIAKGDLSSVERLIKSGAKFPGRSRQHPIYKWLALLDKENDDPNHIVFLKALFDAGLPGSYGSGASWEEIKRLPPSSADAYRSSLLPQGQRGLESSNKAGQWGMDVSSCWAERLAVRGQHTAARYAVSRMDVDSLIKAPEGFIRTSPLEGLIHSESWSAANALVDRIINEADKSSLDEDFWVRIDRAMIWKINSDNDQCLQLFKKITDLRAASITKEISGYCQKLRLGNRKEITNLKCGALEHYFLWFPEDLELLRNPQGDRSARRVWRKIFERVSVLGVDDDLWKSLIADPLIISQLNSPVDEIKLTTKFQTKLNSSSGKDISKLLAKVSLPASPLDCLILQVDPLVYVGRNIEIKDDVRHKNWSNAINQLVNLGALPGWERKEDGFHLTYAEIKARHEIFETHGSRISEKWWRDNPRFAVANPRTGRGPFHDFKGNVGAWNYWVNCGFDPAARDVRGVCGFMRSLIPNLRNPGNDTRDLANEVGSWLLSNPSLWEEKDGRGYTMKDFSGAHPSLLRAAKKSKITIGNKAARVAIWCARPDSLDGLEMKKQIDPEGWTLAGWAMYLFSKTSNGNDKAPKFQKASAMCRAESVHKKLDPLDDHGGWLRKLMDEEGEDWAHRFRRASLNTLYISWGDPGRWTDDQVLTLLPSWYDLQDSLPEDPPHQLIERSWFLLMSPSRWPASSPINLFTSSVDSFADAVNMLRESLPSNDGRFLDAWKNMRSALTEEILDKLDEALASTPVPAWISCMEMEVSTKSAAGRRVGLRL